MPKTQAERLDAIEQGMENLYNQQRILIMQNDKILEFMDSIYTAMAQEAQASQEPPQAPEQKLTAQDAMEMLKDLSGGDDEPARPRASRSWGRNDGD